MPKGQFALKTVMPTEEQILAKKEKQNGDGFSRWIWSAQWSCTKPTMDIHLLQRKRKPRENGCQITKKHGR